MATADSTASPPTINAKPRRRKAAAAPANAAVPTPFKPFEHVDPAKVYLEETNMRIRGFSAGIAALETERNGQQIAFEEKIAALTRDHESSIADLDRRIATFNRGLMMAQAALAADPGDPPAPTIPKGADESAS